MTQTSYHPPLFTGLVFDETGNPVDTAQVGNEAAYVIMDGDFKRHIPAIEVDRQVVTWIQEQAAANKDLVSDQLMKFLGKDDLFTKAMIDSSITRMDEQVLQQGLPDDARTMLGMVGFKVIINFHGELVRLDMPGQELPDDDAW